MQRISESDCQYRGGDSGVKYLIRGPMIDWGVILVLPGESLSGHYHEQVDETFYVISGAGTFTVNGTDHAAKVGDALRMEPQDRHAIRNDGDEPFKVVFIKCPYLPEDKIDA